MLQSTSSTGSGNGNVFPAQVGVGVGGGGVGSGGMLSQDYDVFADVLEDLNTGVAPEPPPPASRAPRPGSAGSSSGSGGGGGGLGSNHMFSNEKIRDILGLDKNQLPDNEAANVDNTTDICDTASGEWKVLNTHD